MCAAPIDREEGGTPPFQQRLLRLFRATMTRCLPERPAGRPVSHFRAVIFKVDRIGDFVLASGAIRTLLREWGEENCLLVVSPLTDALVAAEFPGPRRIVLPPFVGHTRLFSAARAARRILGDIQCDVAISLRHQRWDFDEVSLSWLHAERVHVLEDVGRRSLFSDRRTHTLRRATRTVFREEALDESGAGPLLCRELAMHRQLLSVVLGRNVRDDEVLPQLRVDRFVPPGAILVSPLGSHPLRDIPSDGVAATMRAVKQAGRKAVLVGNPSQAARLAEMAAELRGSIGEEIETRTDLSLTDFARAVAAAPLIVATESAAAHLGTAWDRPVVAVVGGGHHGQFAPWRRSDRQIWLTNRIECFGCNWRCRHPAPYCVTGVPPESIAGAVSRLLSGEGKP